MDKRSGWMGLFLSGCVLDYCGSTPSIVNGEYILVNSSDTFYGDVAIVACNPGFTATASNITCTETGSWDTASCLIKVCSDTPTISHGYFVLSETNMSSFGATANVECDHGYYANATEIMCLESAQWNTTTCDPKDCGDLANPIEGHVDTKSGTSYGLYATYSCNDGYDILGNTSRQCVLNGTRVSWSGIDASCKIKDCGSAPAPGNGDINDERGTQFGNSVTYTCNEGFDIIGDVTRKCLATGIWSGLQPTCSAKDILKCPVNIDSRNTEWNEALPGQIRYTLCPNNVTGNVSRVCKSDGTWQLPQYNCVREVVNNINTQVNDILQNVTTESVEGVLNLIANVSNQEDVTDTTSLLSDAELTALSTSLLAVAEALDNLENSTVNVSIVADSFVTSTSNLLDSTNTDSWKSLKESNNDGASKILTAVDTIGNALTKQVQSGTLDEKVIVKKNIAIEVKKVTETVVFPDPNVANSQDNDEEWVKNSKSEIRLEQDAFPDNTGTTYVTTAVMYRDMSEILPTSTSNNGASEEDTAQINAPILSLTVNPAIDELDPPVRITFEHYQTNLTNASCTYWQTGTNDGQGFWSVNGCIKSALSNDERTVCECDHLTNFAIIMSPFVEQPSGVHTTALRLISIIGISISIVCLLVTIVVHMCLWKKVRGAQTTLHMNLCIALLLAYVVFLVGVDRTESKGFCSVVAAVLHYIYLVVFCLMLAEGIELVFTVLVVFGTNTGTRTRKLVICAWILPAVIVGISLGATQVNGYGNDSFCWLSLDSGLIWAFVAPALTIIMFNLICLVILFWKMFNMKSMESKTTKEKAKTSARSLCVLVPLMGVSWILGIFYINESLFFMQYIFAIVNGLQGFFIFLFHCLLNKKVKIAIKLKKRRRSATRESLKATLRSTSRSDKGRNYSKDYSRSISETIDFKGSPNWRDKVMVADTEYDNSMQFQTPLDGGKRTGALFANRPAVAFTADQRDTWSMDSRDIREDVSQDNRSMQDTNYPHYDDRFPGERL